MSPRKDAERNRAALLAAAREVFAARGLDATLDDVAAHAGVGTGTAYRNFRDKHELAAEVLAEATEQLAADAEAAAALSATDPWGAVVSFFEATAARQAADRGLYQALAGQGRAADKVAAWPRIAAAVSTVFAAAHAAGVVRPDLEPEDAVTLLAMLGPLYGLPDERWRRYLALLLDGARPGRAEPLPGSSGRYGSLDDVIAETKERAR